MIHKSLNFVIMFHEFCLATKVTFHEQIKKKMRQKWMRQNSRDKSRYDLFFNSVFFDVIKNTFIIPF